MMTLCAQQRVAFEVQLADQGVIQSWVADVRIQVNSARLTVLHAAWRMDIVGKKAARSDVSAAKILIPQVVRDVVDRGIQVFGGACVPQDYILSYLYATARFLEVADGPDEVHRRSIARAELKASPLFEVM